MHLYAPGPNGLAPWVSKPLGPAVWRHGSLSPWAQRTGTMRLYAPGPQQQLPLRLLITPSFGLFQAYV